MKVAYVASPKIFSRGASSIEVMRMAQAMAKVGYDVELIIPYNGKEDGIYDYYGIERLFSIKFIPSAPGLSTRHLVHGFQSAFYTAKRRGGFDIVLSRNLFYALLSTRLLQIPTIYDAHHPIPHSIARMAFKLFKDSKYLIRFVAISKGIGKLCLGLGLPEEKLIIAPNGVDLERFANKPTKNEARTRLGLPLDKRIISHIGNIYPGRGIDLLIEAMEEFKDTLLLIVGGEEKDIKRYKRFAEARGVNNVLFTGFVPPSRVSPYFFATDFLILPYTSNMTSKVGRVETNFASLLKLSEYMASERPIISTSIPAVTDTLRNEENAILVEPDSVEPLVRGIRKAISDEALCKRIANQAAIDSRRYSLEERVRKIFNGITI